MKTKIIVLIIASISLLCNCQRQASYNENDKKEVLQTPGIAVTSPLNDDENQAYHVALSVWRYQSEDGPIVLRIRYINNTKNKYQYWSWVGSPESRYFRARLKMPNESIKEVQIRSGDEYICGSFCQKTEINPGFEIEWLYVLTLAPLDVHGRLLHPEHWSFCPGHYEVSVSLKKPEIDFHETVVPTIKTPVVSFSVIPGINNPRLICENKINWGREDLILNMCVSKTRYSKLIANLKSSSREKRENTARTLSEMTKIGDDDHGKMIKLWNSYVTTYKYSSFKTENDTMLFHLAQIIIKMKIKDVKQILEAPSEYYKKRNPNYRGG